MGSLLLLQLDKQLAFRSLHKHWLGGRNSTQYTCGLLCRGLSQQRGSIKLLDDPVASPRRQLRAVWAEIH